MSITDQGGTFEDPLDKFLRCMSYQPKYLKIILENIPLNHSFLACFQPVGDTPSNKKTAKKET